MDERVGVFPEFRPARLGLFAGLGQEPVSLRLRVLYDPLRLLLCILCAGGGVALYFLGIYKEYFTIRDFFHIRPAGWVGLVIPHLSRRIVGNDCRWLLPMSMLFGAAFLLLVDNLARCLTAVEIPIGILTAFVGAPFFIYLMVKGGERA